MEAGFRSKWAAVAPWPPPRRSLFAEHGAMAVPTLVLFRDGDEVARGEEAQAADEPLSWLDEET